MAEGFHFELDGLKGIIEGLDKLEGEIEKKVIKEVELAAADVVFDGKELSPWLSGDLITGIHAGDVETSGDTVYVDIGVSPEIPYAVRMHEDDYTPGEKSNSSTPNSPRLFGQTRGRKYLERALQANEKPFLERLSKILKKGE